MTADPDQSAASEPPRHDELTREIRRYLAKSYPHNHNYRVFARRLWPKRQLRRRYRRIRALYPDPVESLVDLSVSKGYFALRAAVEPQRPRVLGIDVKASELVASRAVQAHLGISNLQLEAMRLHELADDLARHGGPFQTALLINVYQYLYYGSRTEPDHYPDHDDIFRLLHAICAQTLIFSNCVEFARLPTHVQETAHAQGRDQSYTADIIRDAALRCFHIEDCGVLGRRPLWRLTPV